MSADPLEELRARVEAAQAATERLAREAAALRGDVPRAATHAGAELHALAALAQAARALLPGDLWDALCDLVRGLLMLARAILDRWIAALQAPHPATPPARDIPIG